MTYPEEFKGIYENPTKLHYHCLTNSENNVKHVLEVLVKDPPSILQPFLHSSQEWTTTVGVGLAGRA